jgi:trigger factor
MHRLKISPLAQSMGKGPVDLPGVEAPSLADLKVRVPPLPPATEDDLLTRFHELLREHAKKHDRKKGETTQMGDDVCIDAIGWSGGKLIPFSARFDLWMELAPLVQLPGFAECIAGEAVGDKLQLDMTLPQQYALVKLRGAKCTFVVHILAARAVELPDGESPEFLKKLGRGKNLDEVMESIRKELEQRRANELIVNAQDMVLDELVRRAKIEVPKTLVDEEIRRAWGRLEAPKLAPRRFDTPAQDEAVQAWLNDPMTRAETARRLAISLVLKAIGERDGLKLTPKKLEELVALAGEPYGLTEKQVHEGLRESAELTQQMEQMAWHLLAVEHVMARAKIEFE